MSKRFSLLFVFFVFFLSSCAKIELDIPPSLPEIEKEGEEWLNQLCSDEFRGRKAGTKGDSLAFCYIKEVMTAIGYSPIPQVFTTNNGSTIRNVLFRIQGDDDRVVIVGTHYDGARESTSTTTYPAAEDNASGTTALLMLAKLLYEENIENHKTVLLCFWDAEEVFEGSAFTGSKYFVKHPIIELSKVDYYVNIDAVGHDHHSQLYISNSGEESIQSKIEMICSNKRFNYTVLERHESLGSDYASFHAVKIPYIAFHSHYNNKCVHATHSSNDIPRAIDISRVHEVANNVIDLLTSN